MMLSPFLLAVFTPLALHASSSRIATHGLAADADSVPYVNADGDTAAITRDSATRIVKQNHMQVIFVRVGQNPGVRYTPKAFAKIDPNSVTALEIGQGDNLVKQYGNVAKDGVLTVTVKESAKAAADTGKAARRKGKKRT